jgi:hypothetical protein
MVQAPLKTPAPAPLRVRLSSNAKCGRTWDNGISLDRAILAATIGVMDQPGCRTAHDQGFAQSGKSQVAVQPVAGGPADDPAGEQVNDDG